jgi:hypothetical protein
MHPFTNSLIQVFSKSLKIWKFVEYVVPIYKLNIRNFQHTQETLTNITGVVPFGQELVQMLYTTQSFSSLPLHLSGGGDIPMYKKGYNDATNELTLEKKPRKWQRARNLLVRCHIFHLRKKTKKQRRGERLVIIFYT